MLWVLAVLALTVGLPFFVLSTSSPTLQRWFAATGHPSAKDPYFLYAAGNAGSVLALVSYPVLVEPLLSLGTQAKVWGGLYVVFVGVSIGAAWMAHRYRTVDSAESAVSASPAIAGRRRGRWLLWSFVPSALMLGVTRHLATDVASVPLLWVIPLLLYLTTFIIAFGKTSRTHSAWTGTMVRYGAIPLVLSFVLPGWAMEMAIHLSWFFFAALLGHSRLAEDRPPPDRLTEFYLWISVGGVAGGMFAALIAPLVFSTVLEYPIAIALAFLLIGSNSKRLIDVPAAVSVSVVALLLGMAWLARTQSLRTLAAVLVAIGLANAAAALRKPGHLAGVVGLSLLIVFATIAPSGVVAQERSFFGVYRVQDVAGGTRQLSSGTTNHGTQRSVEGRLVAEPTSYYLAEGPVGQILSAKQERDTVAVLGLGVGGLAAQARPGEHWTFVEIDPLVVDIATNTEYFTYLSSAPADVDLVIGDGRLALADLQSDFDLVIVDAFNSDAIPIHLVTIEAIESYFDKLEAGGVLAIHISNRHFALAPVLGRAATELDLHARQQFFHPSTEERDRGGLASHWVVVARDPGSLAGLDDRWESLPTDGPLWTDDYSDILRVLKF